MNEYNLNIFLSNQEKVNSEIKKLEDKGVLKKQELDSAEIRGHIAKGEHNLRFVTENIKLGFNDWVITGCYYASYHAALSLILTKGYSSKNHIATLLVLIKEFYKKELNKSDIETLSKLLDYQDVLYYVESKNKREDATYTTKTKFRRGDIEKSRLKSIMFINKVKEIITTRHTL